MGVATRRPMLIMDKKSTYLFMAMAACLAAVLLCGISQRRAAVDTAASANVLRVASVRQDSPATHLSPYGPGLEGELLQAFVKGAGYTVRWVKAASEAEAWRALEENRADLVIGGGGEPPATLAGPIAAGPAFAMHQPLVVRSAKRYALRDGDSLCGEPVLLSANSVLAGRIEAEEGELACMPQASVRKVAALSPLLDSLDRDEARFGLVDEGRFRMLQPFFLKVRPTRALDDTIAYRWFWRTGNQRLDAALGAFWQYHRTSGDLERLNEKYFGFLPEETDYYELLSLFQTIEKRLPAYQKELVRAAKDNGIDPLFLAALIYQESRFNPDAVSETNVRGLMQITEDTARALGIGDRTDPVQSIRGGARYLKMLWDRLEPLNLDQWDRWFFTLAAYNQGLGHLYDAMELAQRRGGTGKTWAEVKEAFPLLAWEKYYAQSKYGYTRGGQAVHYVDNIRYYYYVLHGLVVLSRPEAEHLGPLLDGRTGRAGGA
ncbi:MAG: transglycosylase SLT domain-containing protein [Desulfovibrionaceae bacterium]